jgi:hypothetical protein
MKARLCLLLAAAALGFAPLAFAQTGPPQPEMPSVPRGDAHWAPAAEPAVSASLSATGATTNTRVAALVPSGMSPAEACKGFRDLGECSAALHVSQNLNVPFAEVKDKMTSGQSLGAAIHALKPKADAQREARRALEQALEDLRSQG